ncbi:hypothetical protein CW362_20210 [Streptomyces populi]|uniref:Uncharacterized protein n=1 Tax=Streptomyces populi TaxID=2058924 RepID=A0A2I0SMT8_9ACTN|nr:hypothetical protein CW362_20210 [Streptomyces populi]
MVVDFKAAGRPAGASDTPVSTSSSDDAAANPGRLDVQFTVLPGRGRPGSPVPGQAFRVRDTWDDYSFKTTSHLLRVDPGGEIRETGRGPAGALGTEDAELRGSPNAASTGSSSSRNMNGRASRAAICTTPASDRVTYGLNVPAKCKVWTVPAGASQPGYRGRSQRGNGTYPGRCPSGNHGHTRRAAPGDSR